MNRTLAASLLAAAALAGCIEPDRCEEQPCGPCVTWNDQGDRDLCTALAGCGEEARAVAPTALVIFATSPGLVCGWPLPAHGYEQRGSICLEYADPIARGALCHELDHLAGLPVR